MLRIINLVKLFGIKIMGGPFKDVKYIAQSVGSVITPKILGTCELELHEVIYNTIKSDPKTIIDVGAGEGYYAVGFAVKLPDTKIIAFEASQRGQEYLKYIASLNNVKNIEIHGYCDIFHLQKKVQYSDKRFILMDIEGGELKLLDPIKIPELKNIPILVEIHDFIDKSIGQTIKERFENNALYRRNMVATEKNQRYRILAF